MPKKAKRTIRLSAAERQLLDRAMAAQQQAYAPYSRFQVGAALQSENGEIFIGVNLENASYGATVCAERNAVAQAVSQGQRKFVQLAVVTSASPPAPPCGMCLQVLVEFCPDLRLLLANPEGEVERTRLSRLLPRSFVHPK